MDNSNIQAEGSESETRENKHKRHEIQERDGQKRQLYWDWVKNMETYEPLTDGEQRKAKNIRAVRKIWQQCERAGRRGQVRGNRWGERDTRHGWGQ